MGPGADVAGERKVTVGARLGLGRVNFGPRQAWGSTLSELRRLNAEMLAAAEQLKPAWNSYSYGQPQSSAMTSIGFGT